MLGRRSESVLRARARLRAVPVPLRLILLVAAVQALAWTLVVAPLEGPDEPDHVAYVQHVAQTGHAPHAAGGNDHTEATEEANALDGIGFRSLQTVAGAKGFWSSYDRSQWKRYERTIGPHDRSNGDGPNPLGKNPPLYYALQSLTYWTSPGHNLFTRLTWLRWGNALIYLATIAFTWLLAGEVFGAAATWRRTLATGVVALEPMLAFMGGIVNADTLLVAVWTAFAWAAVRAVRRGPGPGSVAALFGLTAASLLTHGRGLAMVPALAVALLVIAFVHRPPFRAAVRWLAAGVAVLAVPLGIYKVAFASGGGTGGVYGGEVNAGHALSVRELVSFIWQFYLPKLSIMHTRIGPDFGYRQMLIEGFYGQFGTLEVRFSPRVYDLLQLGSAIGLAGLYSTIVMRWRSFVRNLPVVIVLLGILVSMALLLHVASYRALAGGAADPLITGRYVLPLVSLFGLAVAYVVGALPRRASAYAGAFVLGIGVVLQLSALGLTLERFYA